MSLFFVAIIVIKSWIVRSCYGSEVLNNKGQIGFVILNQPNTHHNDLAEGLKENILHQAAELNITKSLHVYRSYEDFGQVLGHWTVIPLFQKISETFEWEWVFFLEGVTHLDLQRVIDLLATYDSNQNVFAGYALKDSDPTIIHHFATSDQGSAISYPHFSAGFFLSLALIKKLKAECEDCHFSIDPKYELAKYVWNAAQVKLTAEPRLCLNKDNTNCATWINQDSFNCKQLVSSKKLFVAAKTCHKFHKDRVAVLKNTWGAEVENLHIFSDVEDGSVPTIRLAVENVERGHCEKTLSILKFYEQKKIAFDWLIVVDDDTLLSYKRLNKLLTCYNSSEDVALGERYGYNVLNNMGYDYLTGGSGMVFSVSVVKKLVQMCHCPSADSPDDMIIGACLKNMQIPITHSPLFHQARPSDYTTEFLKPWKHISFHKHWMVDPYSVYKDWLLDTARSKHMEL